MLNAEDDQCKRKNAASDFGENGNEILPCAKARDSAGDSSGEHPGCGREGQRLNCASAIVSAVDYVVQMKGVKEQDAEEQEGAQEDRRQSGVSLGQESCTEGEQDCAGDVDENGTARNPGGTMGRPPSKCP